MAKSRYCGVLLVTEQGTDLLDSIGMADSAGMDAHKWFCRLHYAGVLMVKNAKPRESALRTAIAPPSHRNGD